MRIFSISLSCSLYFSFSLAFSLSPLEYSTKKNIQNSLHDDFSFCPNASCRKVGAYVCCMFVRLSLLRCMSMNRLNDYMIYRQRKIDKARGSKERKRKASKKTRNEKPLRSDAHEHYELHKFRVHSRAHLNMYMGNSVHNFKVERISFIMVFQLVHIVCTDLDVFLHIRQCFSILRWLMCLFYYFFSLLTNSFGCASFQC